MRSTLIIERLESIKQIADNTLEELLDNYDENGFSDKEIYEQIIDIYVDGISNLIKDIK